MLYIQEVVELHLINYCTSGKSCTHTLVKFVRTLLDDAQYKIYAISFAKQANATFSRASGGIVNRFGHITIPPWHPCIKVYFNQVCRHELYLRCVC